MNYRKFGNTGEKISALGFGCMRFPEYEKDGKMYVDQDKVDEMVAEAYRQGVNYFDTAPKYCNCNSEEAVGKMCIRDRASSDYISDIIFLKSSCSRPLNFYLDSICLCDCLGSSIRQ